MRKPPRSIDLPARGRSLVYAILGAIAVLFGLSGLLGALQFGGYFAAAGVGGVLFLIIIGSLISLVGTAMAAWGGYRMYQADRGGKRSVIYGLVLNALGGLVTALGSFGGGLAGWIVSLVFIFVLYYLVIISRFEDEPKLVA